MIKDRFVVSQELVASHLRRQFNLKPIKGKECFISILPDETQILVKQKIQIVFIPSNLGKGLIALLVCPISGNRCRKLHFIEGVYQYNLIQKNFYSLKTPLKYSQPVFYKACQSIQANQELEVLLDRPYFKTKYKGKVTKRYEKALKSAASSKGMTMMDVVNGRLDYLLK